MGSNDEPLIIETNLDATTAQLVAATVMADAGTLAQAFEITVDGALPLSILAGAPPSFRLTAPAYGIADRPMRCVGLSVDWTADATTLTLRTA